MSFSFSFFHSSFIQLPLGFKLSCGKSVKYRYIEFFAFDYDSLPISFQSGIAFFPLVALDKISAKMSVPNWAGTQTAVPKCTKPIICILINLIFDVGKTIRSHSLISLIYMYSYGKIDFDLRIFGLLGAFKNATQRITESRLLYIHT